jgi:hypothetical protein
MGWEKGGFMWIDKKCGHDDLIVTSLQVSCTVTFDPDTEGPQLKHALDHFQYMLKGACVAIMCRV